MTSANEDITLNLNAVCRLCMQAKPTLLCLFSESESFEQVMPLRCKIMSLVPAIKMDPGDGLPTRVCRQCVNQVNVSYNFKRQCELSDAAFREYLKSHDGKTNESQNSMNPPDDNDGWAFMNVKVELSDDHSDGNNAMEHGYHSRKTITQSEDGVSDSDVQLNADMDMLQNKTDSDTEKFESSGLDSFGSNFSTSVNTVEAKKRFACVECGKTFVQKQHLVSHMRTHTGERPYHCTECGKTFAQPVHLKNHKITHTHLKPFSCSECGKCFAQNIHLKNHLATHTGEKPYGCSLCGKTFAQNVHLKNHLSTHTGEKPFRCSECGKTFSQNVHLKNHLITHTQEKPYGCTECGKTFAQNIHLKNHLATHTGERPYGCSECGKHFARLGQLKEHMKVHFGVKPYSCSICCKSFAQNIHLKNHLATHSTEKKVKENISA